MTVKRAFLKSGLMLAAVSLLMRSVSLLFNALITEKVGAEGMGLLSLTMSVYAFAVTFATSGISLAVTRQVAAALGRGEGERARRVVRCAFWYACFFGGLAALILYFGSDWIAQHLLSDIRTRSSLRLLSISLLPIALSSVFSGYFVAVRRVGHNAVTQVIEQVIRIGLTLCGLTVFLPRGLEYACLALVGGSSLAELCSFFLLLIQIKWDLVRHPLRGGAYGGELGGVAAMALPCAISAHARSGLVTVEHLLIPYCLSLSGIQRGDALASYAAIHSMTIPLVLFPSAILGAFSGLLVPECAEMESRNEQKRLSRLSGYALGGCLLFSVGCATMLFLGAEELGWLFYRNSDAGRYIRALAPLVPVMYADSVVDAHLKGLGHQVYAMGVNIIDAAVSVAAVWLILPGAGAEGYIYVIYLTELLNFSLSLYKLCRLIRVQMPYDLLLCAALGAGGALLLGKLFFSAVVLAPLALALKLFAALICYTTLALLLLSLRHIPSPFLTMSTKVDKSQKEQPF